MRGISRIGLQHGVVVMVGYGARGYMWIRVGGLVVRVWRSGSRSTHTRLLLCSGLGFGAGVQSFKLGVWGWASKFQIEGLGFRVRRPLTPSSGLELGV